MRSDHLVARPIAGTASLVAPRSQRHVLEDERLLVQHGRRAVTRVFPRRNVREPVVVTQRLSVAGLMLDPEVPAARFLSVQRIDAHELRELEEVGDATRALELLVELLASSGHEEVLPELFAKRRDQLECSPQTLGVAGHAAILPHDLAQLAVKRRRRALAMNRHETSDTI